MNHQLLLWGVFTACGLFAIVYKAVMSAGSELTPFHTTAAYFARQPVTVLMHFLLAQFGYFFVISNPALLGRAIADAPGMTGAQVTPLVVSGLMGLGSDKVADVLINIGQRLYKLFGNGAQ